MILITSFGEFPFILLLSVIFFNLFQFTVKRNKLLQDLFFFFFLFGVVLGCPVLAAGEHVPMD